ncbi:glycerol-3-phosphate dehydrogenase subunit GlpB [Chloroflexales bacterium ZM16-3]|nr:glycerol-3-phosphate dehydrogenase subunit GlpB [Chloroflexales bacterium ZM16-3]
MYDTIVIGAGIAGMLAAIGRAEAGERVLVLAKGHGATHWAAGCLDLLDIGDGDPLAGVESLIADHPDHPYALAGVDAVQAGAARLRAVCEAGGYPLVGSLRRNLLLPTAVGALRTTCLVPATMAAGDARQLPKEGDGGGPLLIAGFRKLRDFFPPMVAANLRAQGFAAEGAYLALPPSDRTLDFSTVSFARLFDQPAFRADVGRQLRQLVQRGGYSRIGLPAVLGLANATQVVGDLQAAAGALIFEIPTLPASVPGMRLYRMLEAALLRAGGRMQIGAFVQRAEAQGDRLDAIYTEAAAREQRHRAARYILATGGIAGGGVRAVDATTLVETALGLPLRTPNARADWFAARFLNETGHPVFRSGVATDSQLRPLDAAGQVVYQNVAIAGSALAGCDSIREGSLEGIAAATGWMAGRA